jgi:RsiW-degrading membrane proteinase PrsW (M82 family)
MEIYERKHVLRGRDFFSAFPGNRIDGALLPFNTWWHWGMAAAALVVFLAIVRLMFGPRATKTQHLFWTAVFTAVVGSLGFVALHYATNWTEGFEMRGGGEIAILFYLCKFTSYSYYAAMRQYPFVMSFLSFAIGAGLLIELLKATPLLLLFTSCKGKPGWRGLALWGMAAGIGFGAAEGINYAREFYNGSAPASDYLTRFVTGTALHAIWTASVGVGLFNLMEFDRNKSKKTPVLFLIACALPVILHALFATYLNRGMETGALVTGAISFLWLALQIEWASVVEHARRQLSEEEPGVADERKGSVADPVSALTPGD